MPVIFASSILSAPLLLQNVSLFGFSVQGQPLTSARSSARSRRLSRCTCCCTSCAIIFFAYFYISIVFRPDDIADNMRKYGGFIPGIRPGKRTSDFINDVLTRITLVGALYLIVISIIPMFLIGGIHFNHISLIGAVLRPPAGLGHQRSRPELLLRRHVAADRRRRRDGHGATRSNRSSSCATTTASRPSPAASRAAAAGSRAVVKGQGPASRQGRRLPI